MTRKCWCGKRRGRRFFEEEKMDVSERKKDMVDFDSEVRPLVVAVMIS